MGRRDRKELFDGSATQHAAHDSGTRSTRQPREVCCWTDGYGDGQQNTLV